MCCLIVVTLLFDVRCCTIYIYIYLSICLHITINIYINYMYIYIHIYTCIYSHVRDIRARAVQILLTSFAPVKSRNIHFP